MLFTIPTFVVSSAALFGMLMFLKDSKIVSGALLAVAQGALVGLFLPVNLSVFRRGFEYRLVA